MRTTPSPRSRRCGGAASSASGPWPGRGDLDTAGAYQLTRRGRWRFRRRDFDGWHAGLRRQSDPYAIEPPSRRSLAKRKKAA